MALFLDLLLGHMLGDFLLQPGKLVAAKRDGWRGLLLHSGVVGAVTALVTVGTLRRDWLAVIAVTIAHILIEKITILAYKKTPTRGLFTLMFDQSLHVLSIGAVVLAGSGPDPRATAMLFGFPVATRVLAVIVGFVTVTLAGSILSFEAANALAIGGSKGALLTLDLARVGGMVERGGAVALALVVGPALGAAAFLPRAIWAMTLPPRERSRQLAQTAAGLLLCAFVLFGIHAVTTLTEAGSPPVWAWPSWSAGS